MKTKNPFKALFAFSVIITIIGAFFKIQHWPNAQTLLVIGILSTIGYIIRGIYEVQTCAKLPKSEKIMWTVGFIFFGFITGIVYILQGQRRMRSRY